jgi:hypothetical protein
VSEKALMFYSFLAIFVAGCALFISWRLSRIKADKAEAERRQAVAFAEMNRLTKQLRERPKTTEMQAILPPGERLKHMYPGARRPQGDPRPS